MHPETAHTAASVAEQKRALLKRKLAQAAMTAYPLSHGQQALWFLHTMVPDSAAYNIAFAVRIRSTLDVEKLRQAFQTLIGRHAALRTTFSLKDGEPVQVVHGHKEFSLEQIDAAGWDAQQLHQQVVGAYRRPFNLESGPLLRAYLFQLDQRDCVLLLSAHHIIGDGWSLWMLLDEWRTLYELDAGESAGFAPLKLNYTDHVRRQQDMLAGPRGAALRAYWQRQLAGELPALSLPVDHARPAQLSYRGASWTFRLAPQLTQGVKALAKAEGVTLYTLLLAAYQVLLYRYSHQERILVGSPMAGRMENDLTGVVGYFVNPVVLSADLSAALTFKQLLVQARERVLGALAHQDYPFSLLVEQLQLERDGSRNPLFQAAFMLQKSQQSDEFIGLMSSAQGSKRLEWKNLSLEPYELMQQEGQFDLTLEMADAGDALVGVLKYSTDLFEAATMQRMAGHLTRLLEAVVAEPGMRVADLPLLPHAERNQLLLDWNDTARTYPLDTLHGMVEAQAARTPDRVAVAFDGQELSYAELNGRANQLAGHLRGIGVTTETLVGVCLERSLDLVVALLGILKAGGAYVPLDPAYPSARLAYMLEHAHPRVLISQESLLKGLPDCSAQLFCMDRDWPMAARHAGGNPEYPVEGEHIAYVIYTSGSTGKPKGVQVPHRGVVNFLHTMRETPGVAAD
ncbi:non-ribosomal peptide synthetase, partial [Janthinobacterium sp. CG3]